MPPASRWMPLPSLVVLLACGVLAQQPEPSQNDPVPPPTTGFLDRTLDVDGRQHRYVVYVPPGYTKAQRWPLLVFLNGKGECGTDGKRHVEVGLGPAIRAEPERWPFVVLFPQKPDAESWWPEHEAMVLAMLARTEQEFAIDEKRRFLTGLSQGGHGTWVLGARHAGKWAAIAPVCGFTLEKLDVAPLKDTPIWAFHGADDRVVPAKASRELCAAVRPAGGDPVLTIYDGVGHNSWDRAYRESGLAEWLRLTAVSPVAASCASSPKRVTSGSVSLSCRWWADVGPHGRGTRTALVVLRAPALEWTFTDECEGKQTATRRGQVPRDESNHWLARIVVELARVGACDLPDPVRPAAINGIPVTGHGLTIDLDLDGPGGRWRFRREVPEAAEWDPAYAGIVRGIVACIDRAADWR